MFNEKDKQQMAAIIETLLLSYNNSEMPKDKPNFSLHVNGKESWSFTNIEPNWHIKKGE